MVELISVSFKYIDDLVPYMRAIFNEKPSTSVMDLSSNFFLQDPGYSSFYSRNASPINTVAIVCPLLVWGELVVAP